MVFQRINRIVGGADHFHLHLRHDTASGEAILGQQIVTLIPDFIRGGRRQQLTRNPKRAAQLQMRPVIERIADRMRYGSRPCVKLLAVRGIAGTQGSATPLVRIARHL